MAAQQETYNYRVVRQFAIMTVVWGIVGMLVGVFIAAQMAWPALNFDIPWLTFSRLPDAAFYLFVPVGHGAIAKRICKQLGLDVYGYRTWRYVPQGMEINDISEPPGIIHALMPPFARKMMRGM